MGHQRRTVRCSAVTHGRTPTSIDSYQSTVMVAVDVSFLVVPSVDLHNAGSIAVISTYISLFCIVGSFAVSFFLTRQNRMYRQEFADTTVSQERCTDDEISPKQNYCRSYFSVGDRICIWH
ncbi:uncharacterized protein BJ212DRAFT_778420 [Suillus subaureus]|uniref:Uncharacterized protein n=1 Tax=Suillus subaureus TaxID=48587 RepID=A0A9P7J7X4_9AGAM|nr:uncharacterized protein BJ212DRAFT_778420 [Suillus subaureus]KAG1807018.1 hypothetical protein BJ212DRAFT_778420 [Suillus subaureus]